MENIHNITPGQVILYSNGDRHELGVVKRVTETGAFVNYHMGDTAAHTGFEHMKPIENEYAFLIVRKSVETEVRYNPILQLSERIILGMDSYDPVVSTEKILNDYNRRY